MKTSLFLLFLMCSANTLARELGMVGAVFPVAEKSFLALIEERLQALAGSGALERLQNQWVMQAARRAERPRALLLPRASHSARHTFASEVTLSQDVQDAKGRVLHARGTRINALEKLPAYQPCWLFFNADDVAQVRWAQRQSGACAHPKFILTGGSVREAELALNQVMYFDQGGRISAKLSITHVPARVTREDNRLVIDEYHIGEDGHVL